MEERVLERECGSAIPDEKRQKYSKQPRKLTMAAALVHVLESSVF